MPSIEDGPGAWTSPISPLELKAFRQRFGLPQGALAALLGVSRRTVEDWEGARREPQCLLRLALSSLAADIRPWRSEPVQVTRDADGYRVRYQPSTGQGRGEFVVARSFLTEEAATAFARFWEGADTCWDGRPIEHERRFVSGPSLAQQRW
jgi:DNA-binding XRE family transcriptional regulator